MKRTEKDQTEQVLTFGQQLGAFLIKLATLKFLSPPEKLDEEQQQAIDIVKACLEDKTNEVLWAPNGQRMIDGKETFIIVKTEKITIINHGYQGSVWISENTTQSVLDLIDTEIGIRRSELERRAKEQVTSSLGIILKDMKLKLQMRKQLDEDNK